MRARIFHLAALLLLLVPSAAVGDEMDPVTGYPLSQVVLVDMQVMPGVAACLQGQLDGCFKATSAFHREYIAVWAHFMLEEAVRRDPDAMIPMTGAEPLPASMFVEMGSALYPLPSEAVGNCAATGDCLLAERVMTLGCAADVSSACIWLAQHYQQTQPPEGYWTSASLLLWACTAGDAKACAVFSGHVNPGMSWGEGLAAAANAGTFPLSACVTDNDPLACAALGAQGSEDTTLGMVRTLQEQFLPALLGLALTHCSAQLPALCQLADRLFLLGGYEPGQVKGSWTQGGPPADVDGPAPVADSRPSRHGPAISILPYAGLGAMRSLTL